MSWQIDARMSTRFSWADRWQVPTEMPDGVPEIADEIAEQYATIRAWTKAAVSVDAKVACLDLLVDTDLRLAAWMRQTQRAERRLGRFWIEVLKPAIEAGENAGPIIAEFAANDPRAYRLLRFHTA